MTPVFALVDCNSSFYASCEKLFRLDLRHTPVVVLSNSDGCVVARSKEAKALDIKMGVPVHHIQPDIRRYKIQVFSSHYALYGDMSHRVMVTLESLAPRVDVYSIDEAPLDLTGNDRVVSFEEFGCQLKSTVFQSVGLPICVGIAPTLTLAKLANYAAKHYPVTGGVVDLTDNARQRRLMARVPVDEVWGVGRKLSAKLQAMGIETALELADADPATIRKRFSVVLERTARELRHRLPGLGRCTPGKEEQMNSFTVITLPPHPRFSHIYPKSIPLMLRPDDFEIWLDPDFHQVDAFHHLLKTHIPAPLVC